MGLFARIREALGGSTPPEQLARDKFRDFQRLLESNDSALERMAVLSELLATEEPFSYGAAARIVEQVLANAEQMVSSLVRLSAGRYAVLHQRLAAIAADARSALAGDAARPPAALASGAELPYTIDLQDVDVRHLMAVGGKMARLGELKNVLGLPVPDGFCVTHRCFDEALAAAGLGADIEALMARLDLRDAAGLATTCAEIQSLLASVPIPGVVEAAVLGAYDAMSRRLGRSCRVAVRSSAVGEDDSRHSFAGLHHTALNVPRDGLLDACWEVLISKYSPQSVVYRVVNGLRDRDMPMNIGCLPMLRPRASGTLFTADPRGERRGMIIHAVRGLGALLVEGALTPDEIVIAPGRHGGIELSRSGNQSYALMPRDGEGLERTAIAEDQRQRPLLTEREAGLLAAQAATIEEHFRAPQDIEWTITEEGAVFVLQARPLLVTRDEDSGGPSTELRLEANDAVLLRAREVGCAGAGSGPVFVSGHERQLVDFPMGGVLVIKQTSPAFARILHRAAAVVAEVGSASGHFAIIARELGVPLLLGVPGATTQLQAGALVTVDAHRGVVLAGRVDRVLPAEGQRCSLTSFQASPVYRQVSAAADRILPLGLTDARAASFVPKNCHTIHDITRFCHEMAIREMFDVSGPQRHRMRSVHRLEFAVPLEVFVVDLGGGLTCGAAKQVVRPEEIASAPFRALVDGMSTPGLRWAGPVPIELRGFAGLVLNTMMDTERASAELGSEAYALVSEHYVNYSARMGYHFASLDAYASGSLHRNYISYRFKGGAAESARRARRASFIARVLRHWGFTVVQQGDRIDAALRKLSEPATLELLREIGRLLGAVRNADLSMYSDEQIERYAEAFLAGACSPVEAARDDRRSPPIVARDARSGLPPTS
jgi:pyruvate,water dikinase